jgi:hypothetical protein
MTADTELDLWRAQWRSCSEIAVAADLSRRVERQSRWMRIMLIVDVLVTVGIGGTVAAAAVLFPNTDNIVLAVATWLFIASAWFFAAINHRGMWKPETSTTAAFLDISLRRCRARLRATVFGAFLYVTEIAFCLMWLYHYHSQRQVLTLGTFLTWNSILAVWLVTLVLLVAWVRYRRAKSRELAQLRQLSQELNQA